MDIKQIRVKVSSGHFAVDDHALTEALKEGILVDDMVYAIMHGKIIEDYPERSRCLIFANLPSGLPLHVVVEYAWPEEVNIITTYIPEKQKWIESQIRKRRSKKR